MEDNFWKLMSCKATIQLSLVTKSCLTVCDPMNCSMVGFSVHRISQAIILEWVAISSANPRILPSPRISCLAGGFFSTEPPGKPVAIN